MPEESGNENEIKIDSTADFYEMYKKRQCYFDMVSSEQLCVCKSCGNVFSKKAGATNITECPQCKGTSFEQIVFQTRSEDEKMYLNEEG